MSLLQLLYRLLLSVYYNTVSISCQPLSLFLRTSVEAAFLSYVCIIALTSFTVKYMVPAEGIEPSQER